MENDLQKMEKSLTATVESERARLAPLVAKREALVAKIQALELELRPINEAITKMENELLVSAAGHLARLARSKKSTRSLQTFEPKK